MNDRTHFFIKIYLSHFILERVGVGYVWKMNWRRGQTVILTQQYFFLILAGLHNHGPLRVQCPLSVAGSQFGILSPTDLNRLGQLAILLFNTHLLPLFFCLFTQMHLLIDGSVEGQYKTIIPYLFFKLPHVEFSSRLSPSPLTHIFYK